MEISLQQRVPFDTFVFSEHAAANAELEIINSYFQESSSPVKGDIIISFLRDHSLKTIWLTEERDITQPMISHFFQVSNLERLFESCRNRHAFRLSLEDYIRKKLNERPS